jgi:hypothetical protein
MRAILLLSVQYFEEPDVKKASIPTRVSLSVVIVFGSASSLSYILKEGED